MAVAGCGLFEELPPFPTPTPVAANIFVNPGFEEGVAPWTARQGDAWLPGEVSDDVARSGGASLRLELRGDAGDAGTRAAAAVQEVATSAFPEYVSGHFFVAGWDAPATFQSIQLVVTVYGGDFPDGRDQHEMRFILAGTTRDPAGAPDARYVYLSRDAPEVGEWVHFGYPVRDAFLARLGWIPADWQRIEASFEVRYDGRTAEQPATGGVVYFDDVYLGPAIYNPNRPASR